MQLVFRRLVFQAFQRHQHARDSIPVIRLFLRQVGKVERLRDKGKVAFPKGLEPCQIRFLADVLCIFQSFLRSGPPGIGFLRPPLGAFLALKGGIASCFRFQHLFQGPPFTLECGVTLPVGFQLLQIDRARNQGHDTYSRDHC